MHDRQTVRDLLREGERELCGTGNARLDAEVLLCALMKTERSILYSSPDRVIPDNVAMTYRGRIAQRREGWPVAYLTGRKEFWSIELDVNEDTLVPRPETECLVEIALEHIPRAAAWRIADLGTGCGAIAIALAKERPACRVKAIDCCGKALQVARTNARKLGLENIRFVQGDWFTGVTNGFDLIISNPPYVRDDDDVLVRDLRHEPRGALAGGPDGLRALTQIIGEAPRHLVHSGWLFVEHAPDQGGAVRSLLAVQQFEEIETRRDYAGQERVSFGRISRGWLPERI